MASHGCACKVVFSTPGKCLLLAGMRRSSDPRFADDTVPVVGQLFPGAIFSAAQFAAAEIKVFRADPDRLAGSRRNPEGCESKSCHRRDHGCVTDNLSLRCRMAICRRWRAGKRRYSGHPLRAGGEAR